MTHYIHKHANAGVDGFVTSRLQRHAIARATLVQRTDPDPEMFNNAGNVCSRVIGELTHSYERSETFPLNLLNHEVWI